MAGLKLTNDNILYIFLGLIIGLILVFLIKTSCKKKNSAQFEQFVCYPKKRYLENFYADCAKNWQQCGGKDYSGPTCCESGATCVKSSDWWSMCKPGGSGGNSPPPPPPPGPGPGPGPAPTPAPGGQPTPAPGDQPTPAPGQPSPSPSPSNAPDSSPDSCPEIDALLKEYPKIKSDNIFDLQPSGGRGNCDGGVCEGFYTWDNFVKAVCLWNSQKQKWLSGSPKDSAKILSAFFANTYSETVDYKYCRERLSSKGTTPGCPAEANNNCSAGAFNWYPAGKPCAGGFTICTCKDGSITDKCKDAWGGELEGKYCYYGRGAKQLTWAGNYNLAQEALEGIKVDGKSLDICKNPDLICDNPVIAFITAISYWINQDGDSKTLQGGIDAAINQVVRPADGSSNGTRVANYNKYMGKLGLS